MSVVQFLCADDLIWSCMDVLLWLWLLFVVNVPPPNTQSRSEQADHDWPTAAKHTRTHRLKKDINPSRRYVLIRRAIPRGSEETAERKEGGERERHVSMDPGNKGNCTDLKKATATGPVHTRHHDLIWRAEMIIRVLR